MDHHLHARTGKKDSRGWSKDMTRVLRSLSKVGMSSTVDSQQWLCEEKSAGGQMIMFSSFLNEPEVGEGRPPQRKQKSTFTQDKSESYIKEQRSDLRMKRYVSRWKNISSHYNADWINQA